MFPMVSRRLRNLKGLGKAKTATRTQPWVQPSRQHGGANGSARSPQELLGLQRTVGNRAVVQTLSDQQVEPGPQTKNDPGAQVNDPSPQGPSSTETKSGPPANQFVPNYTHTNPPAQGPSSTETKSVPPANQFVPNYTHTNPPAQGPSSTETNPPVKEYSNGEEMRQLPKFVAYDNAEALDEMRYARAQEARDEKNALWGLEAHLRDKYKSILPPPRILEATPLAETEKKTPNTKYLDPRGAQVYKLSVTGGLIKKRQPAKNGKWLLENFETTGMGGVHDTQEKDLALYVLSQEGDLYSGEGIFDQFHHSSFLAGTNVAAAGMIKVENGKVIEVSNSSGHYAPEVKYLKNILAKLAAGGVALDSFDVVEAEKSECAQCELQFGWNHERRMKAVDWLERHKPPIPDRANKPPLQPRPTSPSPPSKPPTAQKWRAHYAWRAQDQKEEPVGQHRASKPPLQPRPTSPSPPSKPPIPDRAKKPKLHPRGTV